MQIAERGGGPAEGLDARSSISAVSGGDICQAYRLSTNSASYFVKTRSAAPEGFFAAEAAGLEAFRQTRLLRVPLVVCRGQHEGLDYLVLEDLPMRTATPGAQAELGARLAKIHRLPQPHFGGGPDNWIGTTPQPNPVSDHWIEFFRQHRLFHQLRLAEANGHGASLWPLADPVLEHFGDWFSGYSIQPSLLHGDLWSGNQAMDEGGQPVVFDPASYLGDRETDLAMSEPFGGFAPAFYEAYQSEWPLHAGYPQRRDLYQLYHVLNHLNLFGSAYLAQAVHLLKRLNHTLAE